jgi:CHAT domain-containing protein
LEAEERTLGPEHPGTLTSVGNLASLYSDQGRYSEAEALYLRALEVRERTPGPEHPSTLLSVGNLASLYSNQGRYSEAEPLYLRALEAQERTLGPEHPDTLIGVGNLAVLYSGQGRYSEAEPLYLRAFEGNERTLGPEHPNTLFSMEGLAKLFLVTGLKGEALRLTQSLVEAEENFLRRNFTGSEQARQAFSNTFLATIWFTLSLHLDHAQDEETAISLAFETWLRRKGRVLDAQSESLAVLRRNLDDEGRSLLETLSQLRGQEARLIASPPEEGFEASREQFEALAQQIQETEHAISQRSQAFAIQAEPVTIEAIQSRMPEGSGLLQFAIYQPWDPELGYFKSTHLAAYLLHADGRISGIKLAPMAEVEPRLASFRQRHDPKDAQSLYNTLIAPILPEPGALTHLFISPDGPLNLIPFEALQDAQGTNLIETVSLSYLSTGRDLMRLSIDEEFELSPPLVIAAPDYQTDRVASSRGARGIGEKKASSPSKKGMVGVQLKVPIDGPLTVIRTVAGGAAQAAGILADDVILSINGASTNGLSVSQCLALLAGPPGESVELMIARSPSQDPISFSVVRTDWIGTPPVTLKPYKPIGLSSLPTDWAALPGTAAEALAISETVEDAIVLTGSDATADALRNVDSPRFLHIATHGFAVADDPDDPRDDNPMLRAGLVFAGANQGASAESMVLASEVASLDLDGTRLVVLSACESGLGDAENGEGVYGLRRALQLAGSRSQVMSLWPVDDAATMEFMTGFYERLESGQGMSEALRETKLQMMRSEEYGEVRYWAPFVLAGDWR